MTDKPLVDIAWVMLSMVLVLLMQGGFLCLESGLTRSKNAINVAMKNVADLLITLSLWWLVGFGLMFGATRAGLLGQSLFLPGLGHEDPWLATFFLFQALFCATAATIVSGAVAERMRFGAYHLVTVLVVVVLYPGFGHWAWGGLWDGQPGWLEARGFVDFAGSTVVHSLGGWVALAGAIVLGPRAGRFTADGAVAIPGSNLPLAMLGVLFFLVGWVGFNGGSTLGLTAAVPSIVANTLLAATAGGLAAFALARLRGCGVSDCTTMPLNGVIAGLVAVTAGAHAFSAGDAVLVGAGGGAVMLGAAVLLERLRIDDAIGAVPVHLAAGIWGTLAVGVLGDAALLGTGLGAWEQVRAQALGVAVCGLWAFPLAYGVLRLADRWRPLRVSAAAEQAGLNVSEHGARTELVDLLGAMDHQEHAADLSARVPVEPFTEVGQIAARHNRLMDSLEKAVSQTRAIVRDIRDGIVTFTREGVLTSLNPGAEHIFGLRAAEVVGQPVTLLFVPPGVAAGAGPDEDDERGLLASLQRATNAELVARRNGTGTFHTEVTVTEGRLQGAPVYTALIRDVTERRRIQEELYGEKERAHVTLEAIADGVITTDPRGRIQYMNPVAERLTCWRRSAARGLALHRVFAVVDHPAEMPSDDFVRRVLEERRAQVDSLSKLLYCRSGNVFAVQLTAAPILTMDGELEGAVIVFHDVTRARAMERQLSHQATHDALTGLINRAELETRLDALVADAGHSGAEHVLCYIDLDQFKVVNDTCGHTAGDELLRQLSGVLKDGLRGSDVLARLGGDEFGVLLQGCPLGKAREVAEKLRQSVREFRFAWEGRTFAVGASIGLVPVEPEPVTVGQLLSRADAACYAAKDAGRNRVHVYQANDVELATRKGEMRWISRIQRALDSDALRLFQQPIVPVGDVSNGAHHVEILVRMENEDGTLAPPGAFIPAAERYGLIADLDHWVVRNALAWLADHHRGAGAAPVRCAINLSGVSLGDEKFLGLIQDLLRRHRVPPELVCFEITETAAIANLRRATVFMQELKALGCEFALDDFGSGLSSFGYLQTLPVDYLKIDGAFIRDLDTDSVADAMVESINTIGHLMGLKTIAEFVETPPVLARLRRLGVDYAQGYLFQAPAPLEELAGVHRLPR